MYFKEMKLYLPAKFNTEKTKLKYKVYQANANHIWEVIKLMVPQKMPMSSPQQETWTNWLEFVDNNNNPVGIPGTLKTRGIGVVRSAW